MARFLSSRLTKLEKKQSQKFGTRVVIEYPVDAAGRPTDDFMRDWLSGVAPPKKTQQRADLGPWRGFAKRVILVPVFDDWESACLAQQRRLIELSRSRTNKPTHTAPPSVGTKGEAFTEAAPTRPGTKKGRFVEMNDGRTFDRENGKFIQTPIIQRKRS